MTTVSILGFTLVLIVIGAVLPSLVYWDATRQGVDDPGKWAGIVLFTVGTGLVVYALERSGVRSSDSGPNSESDSKDVDPDPDPNPHALPGGSATRSTDHDVDD